MMDTVLHYLKTVIAAGFLLSLVRAVFPERGTVPAVGFACGLLLLTVLLRPLLKIDASMLASSFAEMEIADVEGGLGIQIDNTKLISAIIKEKTEAYIWDKATQLRIPLHTVNVEVDEGGDYPHPAAATISGVFTQQQRTNLTIWIEKNLAIPAASLIWKAE